MDLTPDTWQELLSLLAVIALALAVLDWRIGTKVREKFVEIRDELRDEIKSLTQPIQPGYRNGGESLADVAHHLRRIEDMLTKEEE